VGQCLNLSLRDACEPVLALRRVECAAWEATWSMIANQLSGVCGFMMFGGRLTSGDSIRTVVFTTSILLLLAAPSAKAADDDKPAATPYRPSVSTPAQLSAPGWLELEGGVWHQRGNEAHRDSLPWTAKLAFSDDWGIRVGGEAWVRQTDEHGQTLSGNGATGVVLKRRFAVDEQSAFGVEVGATLPTGHSGIVSGKTDSDINTIYSADLGDWHTDLNLTAIYLSAPDAGTSHLQTLWAAALSRPLNDVLGLVGELSGTHQSGAGSAAQFLFAASYSVTKSLVLDAGMSRRVRGGAPTWQAIAGFTWVAARLF
jgi:hypothetical protein